MINDPFFDLKTTYEEELLEDTKKIINQHNIIQNKNFIEPTRKTNFLKRIAKFDREKNLGDSWGLMEKKVL